MKANSLSQAVTVVRDRWAHPTFIMMVGPPGVGKSTFILQLRAAGLNFSVASTDDLIEIEAKKRGLTYSQAFDKVNFKQLKRQMDEGVIESVRRGQSIVHDQTNMTRKARVSKLEPITDNYFKICVNFTVDDRVLKQRLLDRATQTGKVIPPHVLASMFNNYQAPSRDEGFNLIIEVDNTCPVKSTPSQT